MQIEDRVRSTLAARAAAVQDEAKSPINPVAPLHVQPWAPHAGRRWSWRRVGTITLAFGVFLAAGGLLWSAMSPQKPTPIPQAAQTGPFGFAAAPDWSTLTTANDSHRRLRVAWASTVPWVPADVELAGAGDGTLDRWQGPDQTISSMPEDGIIIVVAAALYGYRYPVLPNVNFPSMPALTMNGVETSWEGGPPREGISRGRVLSNVNGWLVDASVYFGVSDPSGGLVSRANEELSRFATGNFETQTRSFHVEGDGSSVRMVDHDHAFSVEVPVRWAVADENLTPLLTSPTEILSGGTFEMPVSHDPGDPLRVSDAPVAPAALAAMTSTDAFVSLQATGPTDHADDRPSSFQTAAKPLCCAAQTGDYPFTWWWVPFIDQGRGYYLFVAIGNEASTSTSDQAWAMANSLTFPPDALTQLSAPGAT